MGRVRVDGVTEGANELEILLEPIRVGRLVNAIERRDLLLRQSLRHRLVRDQHELFDHPHREEPRVRRDVLDHAQRVELKLGLGEIEVERAAILTSSVQDARELGGNLNRLDRVRELGASRGIAVENGLSVAIRELPG